TNVDLEKEEFWDVDADDMRMLRRLEVWRNPVTAENPDDPALFKTIKTGYDLYAEGRTQFRLNDSSATWESSSPSMSTGHNAVGGAPGDYTNFLPAEAKKLAGMDSSTLSPVDSVRLTLSSATDMNPRQRENMVAAVQGILSRSQGGQKRQGA
ncbi:993_t:CDS:1, partial [Acaulospora colombiana]